MSLGWIIFTLSVLGYLTGGIITLKRAAWWWINNGHTYGGVTKPSELEEDWLPVGCFALFWFIAVPCVYLTRGVRLTGIGRWVNARPVPLAERKAARLEQKAKERQERLDKLKTDIKAAEAELDKVTSLVQEINSDPGNFGTSSYKEHKYGVPGHRGW